MLLALLAGAAAAVVLLLIWGLNLPGRWRHRHIPGPPPRFLLGEWSACPACQAQTPSCWVGA